MLLDIETIFSDICRDKCLRIAKFEQIMIFECKKDIL